MKVISEGFSLSLDVRKIESIKPSSAGVMNGKAYQASANFRTTSVYEDEDPEMGLVEKEEVLDIKLRCETNEQAKEVCELLRKLRSMKQHVLLNGTLPRAGSKSADPYSLICTDTPEQFMRMNALTEPNAESTKPISPPTMSSKPGESKKVS